LSLLLNPLGFSNGSTLYAVEVLMDLHVQLDINILDGSCVDEPLALGNDLCANEMPSVLCLPDLGKLVLEDLVKVASLRAFGTNRPICMMLPIMRLKSLAKSRFINCNAG
jgi:hypothetical protein